MGNVYMGRGSTAGIPTRGKVNEDWEILSNAHATAFDSLNARMLTRKQGQFDKTTIPEIKGRFLTLRMLCKKNCPRKMPVIVKLENLSLMHAKGKIPNGHFIQELRRICQVNGLDQNLIGDIEAKINAAEMRSRMMPNFAQKSQTNNPMPKLKLPKVIIPRPPIRKGKPSNSFFPKVRMPNNPMPKVIMPQARMPKNPMPQLNTPPKLNSQKMAFNALNLFLPLRQKPKQRGK